MPITILAPPPPPTPEGYFGKLKIGATLEVLFEDGWWTVTLKKMQKATPATAASYLVVAPAYQTERWAEETTLRPQWAFRKGGVWEVVGTDVSASAAASSGGAAPAQRKVGAKAKATASKTDEPAAKRGRGAGGASSSSGPGRGGGRGRGGAGRGGSTSRASVAAATPAAPAASSVVIAVPAGTPLDCGEWAELSLKQRVERVLAAPVGLFGGAWLADGVEAVLGRMRQVQAEETAAEGLPEEIVDQRLWPGAAEEGWRVHATTNDGHYRYTSPEGHRMSSRQEALATRSKEEQKQSARQRAKAGSTA